MIDLVFGGMLILVPMRLIYQWWLHHRLRTCHPAIFEDLGSPPLFPHRWRHRGWLDDFIFSSRGFYLNDPDLAKAVIVGRVLYLATLIYFGCLFLVFYGKHS